MLDSAQAEDLTSYSHATERNKYLISRKRGGGKAAGAGKSPAGSGRAADSRPSKQPTEGGERREKEETARRERRKKRAGEQRASRPDEQRAAEKGEEREGIENRKQRSCHHCH